MRTLPLLLVALPSLAAAFPGTFAAPDGAWPDASTTYVMLARQGEQTTLTVAPALDAHPAELGLVLPLPSPVDSGAVDPRTDAEIVPPEYLERVEGFAAPRVDAVACDELIEDRYYSIPPGCTSYEPEVQLEARGDDAVGNLALQGSWTNGDWELEVVTVDDLTDGLQVWLDENGLTVPPGAEALLAEHDRFLVAKVAHAVQPTVGDLLEPLQVTYHDPDFVLPVRLGAAGAEGTQELVITAISDRSAGAVTIGNYNRAVVENECMLELDAVAEWYEEQLDEALLTDPLPSWMLEYSGPPERCAPCLGDPLEAFELLDFGYVGEPEDAWISRLRMRYAPEQLDQDLQLVVSPHPESQIRFIVRAEPLEFAFPVCGEGFPQDPGVCESLDLPESGCNTGRGSAGGLALVLTMLALRRRRVAPLVLLALLTVPEVASAADEIRLELSGSTTVLSTDRVRFEGYDKGGPHLLMPMLGVEVRKPVVALGTGVLGVTGGLRGFVGNATPGEPNLPVSFRFLEPHAGLDLRWGQPSKQVAPTARIGTQLALGVLDSSVWKPRATLGVLLHASAGVFVGTGDLPFKVELQGSLVPRTDGWGTSFHPNVRLPNWVYFPGAADLSVVVGIAFR